MPSSMPKSKIPRPARLANRVTQGHQMKPFSSSGRSEEQRELTNVSETGNAHLPARAGTVFKRLVS